MQTVEIINTNISGVKCSGKEVPYDHPTIYLEIAPEHGFILCPYCSKKFVLDK
jgi:uncharacterized Zn-finger protein